MKLKISTFNTQHCQNFLTRKIDYERFAEAIKELDSDIIGLNEMRGEGPAEGFDEQVKILAEKTGYCYCFFPAIIIGGANPYGNGLLSKYPIKSAERIMIPDPIIPPDGKLYETRCVIKAVLDVADGFTVIVSHFGLNSDEQKNAAATVVNALETEKCLFMGDLNVTPENPVLDGIKAKMFDTGVLLENDFLTFPSDTPKIKIDYIFTSLDIKVNKAYIPNMIASDHRPFTAEMEI